MSRLPNRREPVSKTGPLEGTFLWSIGFFVWSQWASGTSQGEQPGAGRQVRLPLQAFTGVRRPNLGFHLVRSSLPQCGLSRSGPATSRRSPSCRSCAQRSRRRTLTWLLRAVIVNLAEAYLKRLQKAEKENLATLRENRRSAWELMAGLNADVGSQPGLDSRQTSGPAAEFRDWDCRSHSRHCWFA